MRLLLCTSACLLALACDDSTASAVDAAADEGAPDGAAPALDEGNDAPLAEPDTGPDARTTDADLDAAPDARPDAEPDLGRPVDLGPQPDASPLDEILRLNHVQARGTHNSYHVEPERVLHTSHAYSHAPLAVQLEAQGVRQFELDLHRRAEGGFEVFHLPIVDPETVCRAFVECLQEVLDWSDAHPRHLPILVWFEPKDELDFGDYLQMEREHMFEIEEEILAVWPRERVFAPDDLRGEHADLPTALAAEGWPTLGQLRGKIIFSMLDGGEHRGWYLEGAPNLAERLYFVHSDGPEDPFAAFFKINNARSDAERIARLLEAGFITTSNVDSAEDTAEENVALRDASLASGSHFLSSDFPAPLEGEDYWMEMPGGGPARCNPLTAPPECRDEALSPYE